MAVAAKPLALSMMKVGLGAGRDMSQVVSRQTKQKEAIRGVIAAANRPLSPDEIRAEAQKSVSSISLATVYRNITAMTQDGWLTAVTYPGMPSRYEVAGKAHHHHFHCDQCDRMFELEGCVVDFKATVPRGFRVKSHEFFLSGRCSTCR